MSYASQLLAMSRGHVPAPNARVIGGDADRPREEIVETGVRAPRTTAAAASATTPRRTPTPAPVEAAAPQRESPPPAGEIAPPARRERESPATEVVRDTVEHHTIVETIAPPRAPAPPAPQPVVSAPIALPPQARWLGEETETADPLVATAETDALRELMRSVRQWTASAPQVIEEHHHAAPPNAPAVTVAASPAPTTEVSIGNVVVTVEDAPASASPRSAPRTTSDRLARNHIRGG